MIVIADTTPVNYLVLIEAADLLPRLFGHVLIPPAVFAELKDPETPPRVRAWLANTPSWLQVQTLHSQLDPKLDYLDAGEREAIALAEELKADQILVDESDARKEAARRKLPFIGTLGILRRAAQLDLIDLPSALARLQQTTFYVGPEVIRAVAEPKRLSAAATTAINAARRTCGRSNYFVGTGYAIFAWPNTGLWNGRGVGALADRGRHGQAHYSRNCCALRRVSA